MMMHRDQVAPLYVGVDGGQSSTTAAVVDMNGHVHGRGTGGPIAHPGNGTTVSVTNSASLRTAVENAFDEAGLDRAATPVAGAYVATTAAIDELRAAACGLLATERVDSGPDIDVVLATGARTTGIALAAGTGAVARAVGPSGAATVGGWGWLMGDEGSAYWLGSEAIRAAVRASEGRGPATALSDVVLQGLDVATLRDLFEHVHTGRIARPEIAALAAVVAHHAATDGAAHAIVDRAAAELGLLVRAARHAVPTAAPVLVTTGGVLAPEGPVRAALMAQLAATEPDLEVRSAIVPAAVAAALVAAGRVDAQTVETARASLAQRTQTGTDQ